MVTLNKEHVICHSLQSPEGDDKVRKNDTAASAPPRLCPCGRPEAAICRLKSSVRFASAVEKGPLRSLNDEFPLPPTSTRYKHLAIPSKYCQNVLAWRRSLQEVSGSLPEAHVALLCCRSGHRLWCQLCPECHDGFRRVEERSP